ncbi:MAG: DUF2511 domain-containing protein [Nautiliaceae bacterium]|jgi:hypothetical protein
MKKILASLMVVAGLLFLGCSDSSNNVKERTITKKELGIYWPFKNADKAIIKCYKDGDIKAPVVVVNGKAYGLTGYADMHYGQNDLKAINKIWADDPRIKGLKVDLGPITKKALELCDEKGEK